MYNFTKIPSNRKSYDKRNEHHDGFESHFFLKSVDMFGEASHIFKTQNKF